MVPWKTEEQTPRERGTKNSDKQAEIQMGRDGRAATYGEVDFCGGEGEASEARYCDAFAIGELLGDVGAEASPDRSEGLLVEAASHLGFHGFLYQRNTLRPILSNKNVKLLCFQTFLLNVEQHERIGQRICS